MRASAPSSPSAASSHSSIFRAHSSTLEYGSRSLSGPPASAGHTVHAGSTGVESQVCSLGGSAPGPAAAAPTAVSRRQGPATTYAANEACSSYPQCTVATAAKARPAAAGPHVLRRPVCQRSSTPVSTGGWVMLLGLLAVLLGLLAARPALQHTRFAAQGRMLAGPMAAPTATSLNAAFDGSESAVGHCQGGGTDGACCGDVAWLLQRSHVLQREFAALRGGLAGVSRELGRLAGQLGQQTEQGRM